MVKTIADEVPSGRRLWVAFDRWYFARPLVNLIRKLGWYWVTKAKKNTVFYRPATARDQRAGRGRKREWVKISAREIMEQAMDFIREQGGKLTRTWNVDMGVFYMQNKDERGRTCYEPIRVVVRYEPKKERKELDEKATYKGMYALVSNNLAAGVGVIDV